MDGDVQKQTGEETNNNDGDSVILQKLIPKR